MTCPLSLDAKPLTFLLDVFANLNSSRSPHGTRYPLASTFGLILIAVLSGCRNYTQIHVFGKQHLKLLKQLGFHPPMYPRKPESRGRITAPNEDTLGSIMASVPTEQLNEGLVEFLSRMVQRGSQAAIDGKALRGADDYVLSVFVNDLCQVVWQEDVGTKENELSCLERSINRILECYPHLKLFTGDAAFCHKTIAHSLIKAKRDYFFQLKAPHTTDLALAEDAFAQLRRTPPRADSTEKRGGRAGRKS